MSDDNKEGAGVPVNPYSDHRARYWQDGFDGKEVDATTRGGALAAWSEGRKTATPPPVMPAAPSDAAKAIHIALEAMNAALNYHNVFLPSMPPQDAWVFHRVEDRLRAAVAALSQTMQPQADRAPSMDRFEHVIQWARDNYQDHSIASLCDGLRAAYYALCRPAEPAAGEQAGAVATLDVCTDSENCNRCKTAPRHRGNIDHAGIPVGNSYGAAPTEYDRLKRQKDEILKRQVDAQIDALLALTTRYAAQASSVWRTFVPHASGDFIELREFRAALADVLAAPSVAIAAREQEVPSDDEQLVATLVHCSREVSPTAMTGYDLASVLSRAAERIQSIAALTQPTTVQQAEALSVEQVAAMNHALSQHDAGLWSRGGVKEATLLQAIWDAGRGK